MPKLFPEIPSAADYLSVAECPLTADNISQRKIFRDAIIERFCFEHNENITVDDKASDDASIKKLTFSVKDQTLLQQALDRLKNPLSDSLVVCKINAAVGHGLFTAQAIPCGTLIALYAGQFERIDGADLDIPITLLQHEKWPQAVKAASNADYLVTIDESKGLKINAAIRGGVARFIQHMPEDVDNVILRIDQADFSCLQQLALLYNCTLLLPEGSQDFLYETDLQSIKSAMKNHIRFNSQFKQLPEIKSAMANEEIPIASANTIFVDFISAQGFPVSCVMTTRDIAAKEQLGVDYGRTYWESKLVSRQEITYFDKNSGYPLAAHVIKQIASLKRCVSSSTSTLGGKWAKGFLKKEAVLPPPASSIEMSAASQQGLMPLELYKIDAITPAFTSVNNASFS